MSVCRRVFVCPSFCLGILLITATVSHAAQAPPPPHYPGKWTEAITWPGRTPSDSVHAVHMALVRGDTVFARPHSQVLAWGNWTSSSTDGGLWAWNPTTSVASDAMANLTSLSVQAPPYNLFCAGHAGVPDESGDLLVLGGTQRGHTGENKSARFRRHDRTWLTASTAGRRWYGNATPMRDPTTLSGRVLATAGYSWDHLVLFGGRRLSDEVRVSDVRRYAITDAGHWDPALVDPTPGLGGPPWPDPRESPSVLNPIW